MISIKSLGTNIVGDGINDDASAINAAIEIAAAAGGGFLFMPPGTYDVGSSVILRSNVTLHGSGIGATVIRQKAGTGVSSTVQTLGAYSLFGGGSCDGPVAVQLRDLQINANRQNGCISDGLAIYGPVFALNRILVCNASGVGVRTEFGVPGYTPFGFSAQSSMENSFVHDCNAAGVRWGGPSDSSLVNCQIYRNLVYNLWLSNPQGSGTKVLNSHCWGSIFDNRMATTACRIDSEGNLLMNNVFEVHIRSNANVLMGGNIYYKSDATPTYGITLGDSSIAVSSNKIDTRIDNCRAGSVYYANDLGLNQVTVTGYNSGSTPSVGWAGLPMSGANYMNIQIDGDAAVSNGSELRVMSKNIRLVNGMAGNTGLMSPGALSSGGSGLRTLCIPN
jgi:hypothetical protein